MAKCKFSTKALPASCAWLLLVICSGLYFIFTCPYFITDYHFTVAIYQCFLTLFVFTNFGFSTFMDPGIYPKASNELVKDGDMPVSLHKTVEINNVVLRMKWCTTCKFYRPPRSSHCSMCDCCIEVFDHHCPWMNNCIGRRNYRYFFQFLVSLSIHMLSIFSWCLLFVLDHKHSLKSAQCIITLCLMAVIGILSIPIIGLTCFHIVLVARGRTTNEQVTGKMRGTENPFDQGCFWNFCQIFCGPSWPGLLKGKKWLHGKKAIVMSTASYKTSDNVVKVYMNKDQEANHRNNKEYSKMKKTHESVNSEVPLLQHPPPPLPSHQQPPYNLPIHQNNINLFPQLQQIQQQHQQQHQQKYYQLSSSSSSSILPARLPLHSYSGSNSQTAINNLNKQYNPNNNHQQYNNKQPPQQQSTLTNEMKYPPSAYSSRYSQQQQQQQLLAQQLSQNNQILSPPLPSRQQQLSIINNKNSLERSKLKYSNQPLPTPSPLPLHSLPSHHLPLHPHHQLPLYNKIINTNNIMNIKLNTNNNNNNLEKDITEYRV